MRHAEIIGVNDKKPGVGRISKPLGKIFVLLAWYWLCAKQERGWKEKDQNEYK